MNFVFFCATYSPSIPNVGNVNSGNMEKILKPSANSGLFRISDIIFENVKRKIENRAPNENSIRFSLRIMYFPSCMEYLGRKKENTLGNPA